MRLLFFLMLAACTATSDTTLPPKDQFYGPTGLAIAPDDSVLFVANTNNDLRYNSGTLQVIDLNLVDAAIEGWLADGHAIAEGCAPDPDHRETLICDETPYMRPSAARFGSFATNISVQNFGDGHMRLFVPTRGDPSVAWLDWDGEQLSCADAPSDFVECDDAHRLTTLQDDLDAGGLPQEPYDVYASGTGQFALVTHLSSATVTLIDSPPDGNAIIADLVTGIFATDANGFSGASGVTGRTLDGATTAYVGSEYEDRIQTFTIGRPANGALPFLLPGEYFFLDGVGANIGGSADTRALLFGERDRLYNLNRNPPALQVIDASIGASGEAQHTVVHAADSCRSGERIASIGASDEERVFVSCFSDGEVYAIDPSGAYPSDVITSGRGPYGIVAAPSRDRVYVTNFLEDTISVIDTAPSSPTRNRVVFKLGEPTEDTEN